MRVFGGEDGCKIKLGLFEKGIDNLLLLAYELITFLQAVDPPDVDDGTVAQDAV